MSKGSDLEFRDSIGLQALLALRADARGLSLRFDPRKVPGLSGAHRSHLLGRGMTFAEHRPYQAGDDIRHIDWRVSARGQHTYSKVFQEESEQPVQILVDQRKSMYFGSQQTFKSVLACELCALMTWAGLGGNDRVGGIVFDDSRHRFIKAAQHPRQTVRIFDVLEKFNQSLAVVSTQLDAEPAIASAFSLASALDELSRLSRPGTLSLLVSDFEGLLDPVPTSEDAIAPLSIQQTLFRLRRHSQIFAFLIYDPLELAMPATSLQLCDGAGGRLALPERNDALVEINRALQARHEAKIRALEALKCIVVPVSTLDDPAAKLRAISSQRMASR